MLSTVVFFVVSVLVSVGVLWWSGDVALGTLIGVICGSAAAFYVRRCCQGHGAIGGTLQRRRQAISGWT